jgi:hypothetical protein
MTAEVDLQSCPWTGHPSRRPVIPPLTSTIARLTIQTTLSSASSGIVEFHNAEK